MPPAEQGKTRGMASVQAAEQKAVVKEDEAPVTTADCEELRNWMASEQKAEQQAGHAAEDEVAEADVEGLRSWMAEASGTRKTVHWADKKAKAEAEREAQAPRPPAPPVGPSPRPPGWLTPPAPLPPGPPPAWLVPPAAKAKASAAAKAKAGAAHRAAAQASASSRSGQPHCPMPTRPVPGSPEEAILARGGPEAEACRAEDGGNS